MIFNQAESRGIRVFVQALIRIGGEQGGTVALSYFRTGYHGFRFFGSASHD